MSVEIPFPSSRIPAVNVSTVPQRSPLRWLVPHIREWLARTEPAVLVEPFAGGGIVSLTAVMEELVDRCIMIEIDHDGRHSGMWCYGMARRWPSGCGSSG